MYHGGGANTSDATRIDGRSTSPTTRAWLRQEENQYLSVPLEQAATFPEPLQRLMGYRMGAYALGYVDDLRDPISVLQGDVSGGAHFGVDQSQEDLQERVARLRE